MQLSIGTVSVTKLAWLQIHCCFAEKGDCTAQLLGIFPTYRPDIEQRLAI